MEFYHNLAVKGVIFIISFYLKFLPSIYIEAVKMFQNTDILPFHGNSKINLRKDMEFYHNSTVKRVIFIFNA